MIRRQAGVNAVETAIRILVALAGAERPQMLKDIARRASMHPAKVHRYLVSFIRQGMVRQDTNTGFYMWGPLALDIGTAALRSVSFIRVAPEEASALRDKAGVTVAVAVWGTHGATTVLVEEARKTVVTKSQLGSILPLLTSATGRVFAAYLPAASTKIMIEAELKELKKHHGKRVRSRKYYERLLSEVRRNGIGRALGDFSPGIHALCCPVLDHKDTIVGAIAVLAPAGEFDPDVHGPIARLLRQATARISNALGHETA
jgi:DNA-binding IclR family transcriptional regulator